MHYISGVSGTPPWVSSRLQEEPGPGGKPLTSGGRGSRGAAKKERRNSTWISVPAPPGEDASVCGRGRLSGWAGEHLK